MHEQTPAREETFDPDDWDAFRALAQRMVDDTLEHLRTLRDAPCGGMLEGSGASTGRADGDVMTSDRSAAITSR